MKLHVRQETFDRVRQFCDGDERAATGFIEQVFATVDADDRDFRRAARRLKLQAAVAKDLSVTTKPFATVG